MARYGPKAKQEVEKAVHQHKHDNKYKNRRQAIAVGLEKARKAGGKVPKKSD